MIKKTRDASERSTNTALLASQNKNIVAMMKIAMAFRNGSNTGSFAGNSVSGELVVINYDLSGSSASRGRPKPAKNQGSNCR